MTDNYLTPEEVEEKYCPFKPWTPKALISCDGPECMAWRWKVETRTHDAQVLSKTYSTTHGHCGLVRQ